MTKFSMASAAIAMVLGGAAYAHHSFPVHYIPEETLTISGTVNEFRYRNPHAVLFVAVPNEQGAEELWIIEWAGSSALRRRGVLADTFAVGDRIKIEGNPARDGSRAMRLNTVSFEDGRPSIGPPDRGATNNED